MHSLSLRRRPPDDHSSRSHHHLLEAGERRRIEVVVSEGPAGRRQVLLQDLSYGPGVGWYVQKTITLDGAHVDALLRSLCCVRQPGKPCPGDRESHRSCAESSHHSCPESSPGSCAGESHRSEPQSAGRGEPVAAILHLRDFIS